MGLVYDDEAAYYFLHVTTGIELDLGLRRYEEELDGATPASIHAAHHDLFPWQYVKGHYLSWPPTKDQILFQSMGNVALTALTSSADADQGHPRKQSNRSARDVGPAEGAAQHVGADVGCDVQDPRCGQPGGSPAAASGLIVGPGAA
jgi:hypothetical protein